MLICLDLRTGSGCRAKNRDSANMCQQCGLSLRYALELHNPDTIIGTYRIINVVGYGGFGAVYEAEDTRTPGFRIALKQTFDSSSVRVFQDEFAVLHRLHQDQLPRYYEMFEAQGNGYLVMEFVPGQSLLDVLEKHQGQPLLEAQVMGYAIQVCDALAYLHSQNPVLIHRDIKPANIRITSNGLIKLVDFGLIKQGVGPTNLSRRALSPAYAPLEQWSGTGIHTTPQSDLYSLGATLYHLLTAKEPYPSIDRIVLEVDPLHAPHNYNPRISAHVSDALMKALSIQAHNRFANATMFKQALIFESGTLPSITQPIPALAHVAVPVIQTIPAQVHAIAMPLHSGSNLLFPVTMAEWFNEGAQRNEVFGQPAGYWCYVYPGSYAIGGWKPGDAVETITMHGFWIGKYPITVQQYYQFIRAGGYTNQSYWTPKGWEWRTNYNNNEGRKHPFFWPDKNDSNKFNYANNQPVVTVTWYEAAAFAAWLTKELASSQPTNYSIRLPTEAEWEVAAAYDANRQRRTYPWGEQEPDTTRAVFDNQPDHPALVGEHPDGAAACGAQEMAGNVWKMATSSHESYPTKSSTVVSDFSADSGDVPWRGGAYYTSKTSLLCGARYRYFPHHRQQPLLVATSGLVLIACE